MSVTFTIQFLISFKVLYVVCQIDLGSFSLKQNKQGDLVLGFNQEANILGFGGNRGVDFTIGEGRFGTKARQGALIGGEKIGVDSNFGFNEAEGLSLGSVLNFGNSPAPSTGPVGQLLSFLERIGKSFMTMGKPSDSIHPFPKRVESSVVTDIYGSSGTSKLGIIREQKNDTEVDEANYYHDAVVENEAVQEQL